MGYPRGMRDAWIQTMSGRRFYPLDPRPEDVHIEDIAHALSLKCRFTGHCRRFYSVAQHSILASEYAEGSHTIHALLHDAEEAYLPDMARPIHPWVVILGEDDPEAWFEFRVLKRQVRSVVYEALNLSLPDDAAVAAIRSLDRRLLATEMRDLMGGERGGKWSNGADPFEQTIDPISDFVAVKSWFLRLFQQYR